MFSKKPLCRLAQVVLGVASLLVGVAEPFADEIDWGAIAESRANQAAASLIGQPVKPYVLEDVYGKTVNFADYIGKKPVYLKFWATWCTTCLAQMPRFKELAKHYQDQVTVIAVNTGINDDIDDVLAYLNDHPLSMPVVRDNGSLANDLGLTVTPQHVLIDHLGRIAWMGHKDDAQFSDKLEQLANQQYQLPSVKANQVAVKAPITINQQRVKQHQPFTSTNGKSIAIVDPNKTQYLWFTSPWCEWYLEQSRPETSTACKALREWIAKDAKHEWLGVSMDVWADKSQVEEYLNEHKISTPFILDDHKWLFTAFDIRDIPAVVAIHPDGTIKKTHFKDAKSVTAFTQQL